MAFVNVAPFFLLNAVAKQSKDKNPLNTAIWECFLINNYAVRIGNQLSGGW